MPTISFLALEASDATVVLTSLVLVFAMLIALCLIITLEGKIFDARSGNKTPPKGGKPAPAPKAPPAPKAAPAPAPAVQGGIPGEVVAAIAAAVACLGDGLTVKSIRRAKSAAPGSRRGAWGDAGVAQNTNPFVL